MNIKDAFALVTGGSSGIGLATAKLLVARGARVAICGRDGAKLRAAAEQIGALAIEADVSDEQAVVDLVGRVISELGTYNVLINNAGFGHFASLLDTSVADMRRVLDTNVFGAMVAARESARHFSRMNYGNIVNIASTAGHRGFAGGTAYCASKFALSAMTECWRAELRKTNVRVMQVNPSEVQTDFFQGRTFSARKLQASDIAQMIVSMLEMEDRSFVTESTIWATNPD